MSRHARRVTVRAYAKLNLCLEVLNRRPDGFHNLRTVFQTISLHDTIAIDWQPAPRTSIVIESSQDILGRNLIERAAEAMLDQMRVKARLAFRLQKRIPMGGGLGGGSTDAAAVLLALPLLAGKPITHERLLDMAAELGSDVPFFLTGGTSLGLGRGTEIYPVAEARAKYVLLVAPDLHVSTPEAYKALGRGHDVDVSQGNACQAFLQATAIGAGAKHWVCRNDFEAAVFGRHHELSRIKRLLTRAGAKPALMTGSGACLFGIFDSREALHEAESQFSDYRTFRATFVGRRRYRQQWERLVSF